MKTIALIGCMLIAMTTQAQDAISRFYEKYENDQTFTNVTITSRMFSLFTDLEIESQEDQEILDAISKLKGLKILAKEETADGRLMFKEALSMLPKGEFDELMSVREEGREMKFMIKEQGKIINELVMIAGGDKEFFILSVFGEIDLKQIAKISKAMDIDGLDQLKKLDKTDNNN